MLPLRKKQYVSNIIRQVNIMNRLGENRREAIKDYNKAEKIATLAENNNLACMIKIDDVEIGICNNSKIIPALRHHQDEIAKYMDGQPNEWE